MGDGYRIDKTRGVATGNEEESMYMVTSGRRFNGNCCFDYGNAETDNSDDGDATMEAVWVCVYFTLRTSCCVLTIGVCVFVW